jgi:hypothetical protein
MAQMILPSPAEYVHPKHFSSLDTFQLRWHPFSRSLFDAVPQCVWTRSNTF